MQMVGVFLTCWLTTSGYILFLLLLPAHPSAPVLPSHQTVEQENSFVEAYTDQNVCITETKGTCYIFACSKWQGPTDCIDRHCWCKPGYCDVLSDGKCSGCQHLTVLVEGVPEQAHNSGIYSAVATYFYSSRPVWKKESGESNWLWYCPRYSYWVITSDSPTQSTNCSAGIISPQSNQTLSPLDLTTIELAESATPETEVGSLRQFIFELRPFKWIAREWRRITHQARPRELHYSSGVNSKWWKYWDGHSWVEDENAEHIQIRCRG
eukprot:GHVS01108952.1.p1 GENE.GHVS01108952.1~~GHVS01108952.1.p1  ORF type:complete len:266 (+),score=28.18 GHVS01108952.1:45-842(+)